MAGNPVRLLKIREVCSLVGLSRASIYVQMRKGRFPRPIYPAPNAPRWPLDEIAEYLDGLRAQRDAPQHAA
ncbi:MAG: AlpA family phage regulatory protein [Rhodospirillaceae bacterium]|nr:AlpA family phage regulatory protein [Rhodospirillaceae bacterium]